MTRLTCLLLMGLLANSSAANAAPAKQYRFTNADEAYADMQQELGVVPMFFKTYPAATVAGAWSEYKSILLNPDTALRGRTKELIGLAVAAQVPCRYCTYAHERFAKLDGATDEEITEAVALAAQVRQWSTLFDGSQLELAQFRKDTDRILQYKPAKKTKEAAGENISTLADIKQTLGFVPSFLQNIPVASRDGSWQDFKGLMLSPTKINAKEKSLIVLGVSAQVPCAHCIYFESKDAKMNGASDQEIQEALLVASLTRKWSTVLNGMQIDEPKFRAQIDQIVSFAKDKMSKKREPVGSL